MYNSGIHSLFNISSDNLVEITIVNRLQLKIKNKREGETRILLDVVSQP